MERTRISRASEPGDRKLDKFDHPIDLILALEAQLDPR